MPIATINPATGETLQTFDALTDAQLDDKIARAARTFQTYRRTPLAERAALAAARRGDSRGRAGRVRPPDDHRDGQAVKAGGEEAVKCAWGCRFYAEHAPRMLADEPAQSTATKSFVRYQPLGPDPGGDALELPVLAGLPLRRAGADGRQRRLLKHASNVPQCALAIEDVFRRAGFPDGAFQTLLIPPGPGPARARRPARRRRRR